MIFPIWRRLRPSLNSATDTLSEPIDRTIAALAHKQGGHVSRRQLLRLGLTTQQSTIAFAVVC